MPPIMSTKVMPAETTMSVGMRLAKAVSVEGFRKLLLMAAKKSKSASQMSSRERNAGRSYGRARLAGDVLQIVTGTTRDSRWGSRLFTYR